MRGKLGFPGYLSYIYVFEWFGRLIKNKGYDTKRFIPVLSRSS